MVDPADSPPALVGCAHGTRNPAGRRTVALLRLDVARRRPDLEVRTAHVDVQKPSLDGVLADLAARGRAAVVVPLLLSAGYHMAVDVTRAVARARAQGARVVAAGPLGPDEALVDVLADRLAESEVPLGDRVLLAAAGSSDPAAAAHLRQVADRLAVRRRAPVSVGFLSAADPPVAAQLDRLRTPDRLRSHSGVGMASYLLAPGHFADRLAELAAAAGVPVTAPLAPHPALADLVLRRYDEARSFLR